MSGSTDPGTPPPRAGRARATQARTGGMPGSALPGPACGRGKNGDLLMPPAWRAALASEWPLRDFLELGALPGAVPCARLHARQLAWEWGLAGVADSVEIVVSELVTNAVCASQSTDLAAPVRLWLLSGKARIAVLVWDACPQPPVRMDADGDAENGRGLLLVEAISDHWGSSASQETGGKVVWAVVTS
jgi:anti-sigma regulatory factor (Ser/Thr protein kinase)